MKALLGFAKYFLVTVASIVSLLWGGFIVADNFIVQRANTVVEPVKVEVKLMKEYGYIHQERVERELRMIRSTQDDMNRFLRFKK